MDVRTETNGPSLARTFTIPNKRGLHARAAHRMVLTVEKFDAHVTVSKDGSSVVGTSIMGLLMLAASKDTEIDVTVSGKDADAAMAAISVLIEGKFGED